MQIFHDYYKKRTSIYVVESTVVARTGTNYRHYHCNYLQKKLINWLRDKGITAQKPIHTLRKEFGRLITEGHNIYAASKRLRHADLTVTVMHYADD